jgi:hypothetical protein
MKKDSLFPILDRLKKYNLTPGNVLLICLSFWLTVMLTRLIIFWSVIHGIIPAVFVGGYHIHHFITGFILLAAALLLLSREILSKYIPLVLFGFSLGLIIDEFLFWTSGHFNYWSLINFVAIVVIGTAMAVTYIYAKREDLATKHHWHTHLKKSRPHLLFALLPVFFLAILLFAMFSYNGFHPGNRQNTSISIAAEHGQVLGKFLKK